MRKIYSFKYSFLYLIKLYESSGLKIRLLQNDSQYFFLFIGSSSNSLEANALSEGWRFRTFRGSCSTEYEIKYMLCVNWFCYNIWQLCKHSCHDRSLKWLSASTVANQMTNIAKTQIVETGRPNGQRRTWCGMLLFE